MTQGQPEDLAYLPNGARSVKLSGLILEQRSMLTINSVCAVSIAQKMVQRVKRRESG